MTDFELMGLALEEAAKAAALGEVPFEDNMPIYFGGSDDQPAAYVEVNVFGRSVPGSAWEKLTESIMAALNSTLGIPEDRTYIRYTATTDWGWNGGNF